MRRPSVNAESKVVALTAALAGVAGVVGSYAAVGFTQAFVTVPIENFLTRHLPDALVNFARQVLGHLGQRLNLLLALGIGVGLLAVLAGLGIVVGRRFDSALASVGLAGVLCAVVATLLSTPASGIGAGIGSAIVVGVAALASATTLGEHSVSGQRRRALGSIASTVGIAIGGYLLGRGRVDPSAGSDRSLRSLDGVGGGADENASTADSTSGVTTRDDGPGTTASQPTAANSRDAATSESGGDATRERDATQERDAAAESDNAGGAGDTDGDDPRSAATETEYGEAEPSSETDTGGSEGAETSGGGPATTASGSGTDVAPTIDGMLAAAEDRSLGIANLEGLVSDGFYQVDINNADPNVDPDDWALTVTGAVESERVFSYDDLTSIDAEHRFVSLRCVSDGLNGNKMDNALWTGVPVMTLLDEAGLPEECCVRLRAADDYYQVFPLEALRTGFLAYGMNGDLLPRGHGAPVRTLIPGHWGEINVKWLTEIEVLEQDAQGYWEKKGWHGTGPVNTVAKFHATNRLDDGRIRVGGHAYAGTRGVQKVEVSTDGGDSWNQATLSERLPPGTSERERGTDHAEDAWRQWEYTYESPGGSHEVVVRAIDGEGDLQPQERQDAFPRGATGWVSKTIDG